MFGRYELLTMLARGGMAEVFLARISGVGGFAKLLVIKRILPHLNDDPEFRDMFVNEGRVAARLNHPNICQVFELGEVNGEVFLAMEYLEGLAWADLDKLLPRGRGVELRVAATVLGQICDGLRFAHEHTDVDGTPMPIVHRDVSPQNLFITTEGVCKLLDFGVSKILTEGTRTRTGMLKGKLPYMAPEQIRGEPVDARADVFSMGVVLWESLTGERLFQRDSDYQIWKAITEEDIPRVTSKVAGLPPQIELVLAGALERDVTKRYPSIRAFAADLRDVAAKAGGTFDNATLAQVLKSLGAGKLAERNERVGAAIGRPSRPSAPVPLPSVITQPSPIVEASDTHSIALRDASVKLRRRPRGRWIVIAGALLAIGTGVAAGLWSTRETTAPRTTSDDPRVALTAVEGDPTRKRGNVEEGETATVDGSAAANSEHVDVDAARAEPDTVAPDIAKPDTDEPDAADSNADTAPDAAPDNPGRPRPKRIVRRPVAKKPPPADAGVAEPGFYSVDSKPYATIYIDDKSYGDTPLFKLQLPAGKHRVRAVRADGKSQRLTITIQPGKLVSSGTLSW